jgi:quinol monooxygenase YgiN
MIIELVRISTSDENDRQLRKDFAYLVNRFCVQPGCLSAQLSQTWGSPHELWLATRWDSSGNLVRHLQSNVYKQFLQLLESCPAPPSFEFLEAVSCEPAISNDLTISGSKTSNYF